MSVKLDRFSILVQLHNLPLQSYKHSTVSKIGKLIGDVQEIRFEDDDGTPYPDIVRMWVEMMLEDRFSPAVKMTNKGRWIYVKYEKLPTICKFCGLINHGEDECYESYTLENIPANLADWAEIPI